MSGEGTTFNIKEKFSSDWNHIGTDNFIVETLSLYNKKGECRQYSPKRTIFILINAFENEITHMCYLVFFSARERWL